MLQTRQIFVIGALFFAPLNMQAAHAAAARTSLSVSAYVTDACTVGGAPDTRAHVICVRSSPFSITRQIAAPFDGRGAMPHMVITY